MRIWMAILRTTAVLVILLFALGGCSTYSTRNLVIVDQGFQAVRLQNDTIAAQFRGYPGLSLRSVQANLLYHAAQNAVLAGARYFRIRDLKTESVNTPRLVWFSGGAAVVGSTGGRSNEADGRDRGLHNTLTISTSFVAEGIVEVYQDRPDDPDVLDAQEILALIRDGKVPDLAKESPPAIEDYVEF